MITVTQTELRNNLKKYMEAVQRGEEIEICRHGKPVATLVPRRASNKDYWKSVKPLKLDGVSLSDAVLEEREEGR